MKKIDIKDVVSTLFVSERSTKWEEKVCIFMIEGSYKGSRKGTIAFEKRDGFI